jgi:hypothetical protein
MAALPRFGCRMIGTLAVEFTPVAGKLPLAPEDNALASPPFSTRFGNREEQFLFVVCVAYVDV